MRLHWIRLTVCIAIAIAQSGCRTTGSSTTHYSPVVNSTTISTCAPVEQTTETGSIEEYVQLGLSRNPRIQEAQHKIAAIRHRVPQVLSLPDPVVNTVTHLSPVETAAGRQAFALGVSQKFTNSQRRATRAAAVADEVAVAEAKLKLTELEVAESIRTACYQLLFIRKSIEVTDDDRESLAQIAEVVLRQYEVKESVSQQDVLNVQTEQSKIENQLAELKQKEKSASARLTRLLQIDPRSQLQIVDQLETTNANLSVDTLIAQAIETRPDLQAQLATIRRDDNRVRLAHLEEKPDFTAGLNWIATSSDGISPVANGDDALLLSIGFNLPIRKSRIQAGICEAQSNRMASESRLASLHDQASEEVFDLVAKLESTRDTLELVQTDIIPKAERTLEISIDEYATDSVSYVQLIANWRNVLRYRITEANLQSHYQQLLASLAKSTGQLGPLNATSTELGRPSFEEQLSPVETNGD